MNHPRQRPTGWDPGTPTSFSRVPGGPRGIAFGLAAVLGIIGVAISSSIAGAGTPSGVALDCSGASELSITSDQPTISLADTTEALSQADSYSCVGWPEGGGEAIYRLDIVENLVLNVALTSAQDLDLFLLTACHSDSCLLASNREILGMIATGSYILVVDTNQSGRQPFQLELGGSPAGVPQVACDLAKPLACVEGGANVSGSVFLQGAFVTYAECSPVLVTGTERWHSLLLPAGGSLRAVLSMAAADGVLWLFSGCGEEALCVGFADRTSTGGQEELNFINTTGSDITYYLVVDTFRAVTSEEDGVFDLTVSCSSAATPGHIPPEVAEIAREVVCEGTTLDLAGNLYGLSNRLTTAPCGAFVTSGGEQWYGLILPDDAIVTITLDGMKFDGALWLFDGCGPDASCVAFADDRYGWDNPLGHVEVVVATKQDGGGHTYYLAVDTVRNTNEEYEAFWDYDLTIECGAKSVFSQPEGVGLRRLWR